MHQMKEARLLEPEVCKVPLRFHRCFFFFHSHTRQVWDFTAPSNSAFVRYFIEGLTNVLG
jgi:hypothetical protein